MEEPHDRVIEISTVTILKAVLILLSLWFLYAVKEIVLLLLISIIISSAIDPLADWFYRKRIPRSISVLLVYIVILGLVALVIALLVPPITHQFQVIAQTDYYSRLTSDIGSLKEFVNRLGIGNTIQNNIREISTTLSNTLFATTRGVFTGFISVITVLSVPFYLTVEENGMKNLIKNLTPFKHQAFAMGIVNRIQKKIGYWVLGQIILSAVIFGLTFIGLSILKVEFALVLALIAGILEVIPYIGPILSAIPAVFFALLQNPILALAVIILYIIIQQLEDHIIVPVVMSRSVGLNPVLVILGILIGGTLGGIIGAVIAVPILSGVSVFVSGIMNKDEVIPEP